MRPANCRDFTRDWLSGALPWPARLSRGERARFRWKATFGKRAAWRGHVHGAGGHAGGHGGGELERVEILMTYSVLGAPSFFLTASKRWIMSPSQSDSAPKPICVQRQVPLGSTSQFCGMAKPSSKLTTRL